MMLRDILQFGTVVVALIALWISMRKDGREDRESMRDEMVNIARHAARDEMQKVINTQEIVTGAAYREFRVALDKRLDKFEERLDAISENVSNAVSNGVSKGVADVMLLIRNREI